MSKVKSEIKDMIEELSEDTLEDLKPLLQRISEWEATLEITQDEEMMEQIRKSEEDLKRGETVAWRDVKRKDL